MKSILIFIIAAMSTLVSAQNDRGSTRLSDGFKITRGEEKGSPFLLAEWVLGYGINKDSTLTPPMLLNYDISGNNLTYRIGEGQEDIMKVTEDYMGFVLKGEGIPDMAFMKLDGSQFEKSKKESKYYLIAKAPSKKVVVEQIKSFDDPNSSGWAASSSNNKVGEYKYKEKLYILNKEGKYSEVKSNKSSILKLFKDQKKKVSDFISSEDLDLNLLNDLVRVTEYYYTL